MLVPSPPETPTPLLRKQTPSTQTHKPEFARSEKHNRLSLFPHKWSSSFKRREARNKDALVVVHSHWSVWTRVRAGAFWMDTIRGSGQSRVGQWEGVSNHMRIVAYANFLALCVCSLCSHGVHTSQKRSPLLGTWREQCSLWVIRGMVYSTNSLLWYNRHLHRHFIISRLSFFWLVRPIFVFVFLRKSSLPCFNILFKSACSMVYISGKETTLPEDLFKGQVNKLCRGRFWAFSKSYLVARMRTWSNTQQDALLTENFLLIADCEWIKLRNWLYWYCIEQYVHCYRMFHHASGRLERIGPL